MKAMSETDLTSRTSTADQNTIGSCRYETKYLATGQPVTHRLRLPIKHDTRKKV